MTLGSVFEYFVRENGRKSPANFARDRRRDTHMVRARQRYYPIHNSSMGLRANFRWRPRRLIPFGSLIDIRLECQVNSVHTPRGFVFGHRIQPRRAVRRSIENATSLVVTLLVAFLVWWLLLR